MSRHLNMKVCDESNVDSHLKKTLSSLDRKICHESDEDTMTSTFTPLPRWSLSSTDSNPLDSEWGEASLDSIVSFELPSANEVIARPSNKNNGPRIARRFSLERSKSLAGSALRAGLNYSAPNSAEANAPVRGNVKRYTSAPLRDMVRLDGSTTARGLYKAKERYQDMQEMLDEFEKIMEYDDSDTPQARTSNRQASKGLNQSIH